MRNILTYLFNRFSNRSVKYELPREVAYNVPTGIYDYARKNK